MQKNVKSNSKYIKNNTINFKGNRKNNQKDERISDKIFLKINIYIKNLFLNKKFRICSFKYRF